MAKINYDNIKVEVNWPTDPYYIEKINQAIAKYKYDRMVEEFGEETMSIGYPIFVRVKELESKGYTYEEAKKIAIEEYDESL